MEPHERRKKKPRSEVEEEERRALDKLLWEKEHLQGELKEKQVQYGNVQERLSELDEVNDDYRKAGYEKTGAGACHGTSFGIIQRRPQGAWCKIK